MVDLLYFVGLILGGVVGGALVQLFLQAPLAWRIKRVENQLVSGQGVAARQEKAEQFTQEMVLALTEAAEMHSQGKGMLAIIKEVGLRHPQVALSLITQFLEGKLKLPKNLSLPMLSGSGQIGNSGGGDEWAKKQY